MLNCKKLLTRDHLTSIWSWQGLPKPSMSDALEKTETLLDFRLRAHYSCTASWRKAKQLSTTVSSRLGAVTNLKVTKEANVSNLIVLSAHWHKTLKKTVEPLFIQLLLKYLLMDFENKAGPNYKVSMSHLEYLFKYLTLNCPSVFWCSLACLSVNTEMFSALSL